MTIPHWEPDDDVYGVVNKIVSHVFGVPECDLTSNTRFVHDLDESLEVVETVMLCEQVFGIKIPDAEAETLETVGQLSDYITRRIQCSA